METDWSNRRKPAPLRRPQSEIGQPSLACTYARVWMSSWSLLCKFDGHFRRPVAGRRHGLPDNGFKLFFLEYLYGRRRGAAFRGNAFAQLGGSLVDRKSTRLKSSH